MTQYYHSPRQIFLFFWKTCFILLLLFDLSTAWFVSPKLQWPPRACSSVVSAACNADVASNNNNNDNIDSIPILYESNRLLIVNKPEGIAHHNEKDNNNNETLGIVNVVRQQHGQRLWGVHRLDRVTSGILVFAKDAAMAQALSASFATPGDIRKVYVGISAKRPTKKKQGWVQGGMTRSRDKSWKLMRSSSTNTNTNTNTTTTRQFAKTRFFTAPFLTSTPTPTTDDDDDDEQKHKYTCLLFRPYTGKTHQLRVAAKSMGLALLGDPIYKDGGAGAEVEAPRRTYLHASGIELPPLDGHDSVCLWTPPPFEDLVKESVISNLMTKHCDVPGILKAMEQTYRY
jgi:tRNA pseudouridine32 synthase/23S rRNA pseudouridine746 synthase